MNKDKFLKLIISSSWPVILVLVIATSLFLWMESDRKRLSERGQVVLYAEIPNTPVEKNLGRRAATSNWFHQGAFRFHRR
jgi:hypothetical protein